MTQPTDNARTLDADLAYKPPLVTDPGALPTPTPRGTLRWWYGRPWRRYNLAMFALGFIGYSVLWRPLFAGSPTFSEFREPVGFLLQGVPLGFGHMLQVNVAYALGPLVDCFVPRPLLNGYRIWAYRLGFSLAVVVMIVGTLALYIANSRPHH